MNKWEDSFKKMSIESGNNKMCNCSDNQGLFVPNRQLSLVVAIILLLAFFIFMTGYFLGKRKAVEQFTQNMQQEAVADKIYTMVLSAQENQSSSDDTLLVTHADDNSVASSLIGYEEVAISRATSATPEETQKYYAQLIGFGTEKAAQLFVKKLSVKGIETEVKKRASKTAKGHTSYWYQVITAQYDNKNDLLQIVDKLSKEENIKDARVCTC